VTAFRGYVEFGRRRNRARCPARSTVSSWSSPIWPSHRTSTVSCADVDAAVDLPIADVLGMRLSDRSGADIAFHARHPSQRSSHGRFRPIGSSRSSPIRAGTSPRFMRSGSGRCRWPTRVSARARVWAVMFSAPTISTTCQDPWGSYSEYSCDMDLIPAGVDWQAGDFGGEDAFYVWGPTPPDDFTTNKERVGT